MKKGRPKKYKTEEERKEAAKISQTKFKAKLTPEEVEVRKEVARVNARNYKIKKRMELGIKPRIKKTTEEKRLEKIKWREEQRIKKGLKPRNKFNSDEERKKDKRDRATKRRRANGIPVRKKCLKFNMKIIKEKKILTPEEIEAKKEAKRLYGRNYMKQKREKNNIIKKPRKKRIYTSKYKTEEEKKEAKKLIAKKSYQNNKEKVNLRVKNYRKKNKEHFAEYSANYRKKNREEINRKAREKSKGEERKEKRRKSENKRLEEDLIYKLKKNLRCCIKNSIKRKNHKPNGKTVDILGCIFEVFKAYIESKWEPWMNWENYGDPKDGIFELNKTWDLDHIIPIDTAITEEDVIRLNHYTNFQPLCSYINRFVKRNNLMK